MHALEKDQLRKVEDKIREAELANPSLSIDLLDHICCMIEEKLDDDTTFDEAEKEVLESINTQQLKEIALETEFLTQNKIVMKKRTLITGVISLLIILAAIVLEYTGLKGGPLLIFVGAFVGIFGFGTMIIIDRFSYTKSKESRLKTILGFIGTGFFLAGIAFHFTAWPFGPALIITGGIIFFGYFVLDSIYSSRNNVTI
ncbi:hypothetical protein [Ekhidna sp.]|uniref:hypothetical protein n=1 Tax=Ekhidna sp. TaxID=2608089 RepID=UPI003CCBF810